MKYRLSASMPDRINFDNAIERFIEELELSPEVTFKDFWEIVEREFITDDDEEAYARALSVWRRLRSPS